MSSFAEEVYVVVRSVPPGRVTTYGTIARLLGRVRGARQVGWAMRNSPDDVPAHRVVGAGGYLSGGWAFGHPSVQRSLLEDEGVRFVGPERCDIAHHLWPDDARSTGSAKIDAITRNVGAGQKRAHVSGSPGPKP